MHVAVMFESASTAKSFVRQECEIVAMTWLMGVLCALWVVFLDQRIDFDFFSWLRSLFLFICIPGNVCLDAGHCTFYAIEGWIFGIPLDFYGLGLGCSKFLGISLIL